MNEIAVKGLLKIIKGMIPPATIREAANTLIKSAIDFSKTLPLDTDKGETQIAGIIYKDDNNIMYCGIAFLNDINLVTRIENIQEVDQLINTLIQKL